MEEPSRHNQLYVRGDKEWIRTGRESLVAGNPIRRP